MGVQVGLLQCSVIVVGCLGRVGPVGGIGGGGRQFILFGWFYCCGACYGHRVSVLGMSVHCMWLFGRLF